MRKINNLFMSLGPLAVSVGTFYGMLIESSKPAIIANAGLCILFFKLATMPVLFSIKNNCKNG